MEKTILTAQVQNARYEYNHEIRIGENTVHVRAALTRKEREEMALEQASAVLVFDEDAGLVYEGYNRDLAELMCILKWYTDVELGAYATEEGRYLLSDIMESHGTMTQIREIAGEDLAKVQGIYADLKTAARRTFEQKHGLSHLIRSTLGAILGGEDITKTVAHAQDINASLIDMLGALNREKAGGEGKLLNFARRDLTT